MSCDARSLRWLCQSDRSPWGRPERYPRAGHADPDDGLNGTHLWALIPSISGQVQVGRVESGIVREYPQGRQGRGCVDPWTCAQTSWGEKDRAEGFGLPGTAGEKNSGTILAPVSTRSKQRLTRCSSRTPWRRGSSVIPSAGIPLPFQSSTQCTERVWREYMLPRRSQRWVVRGPSTSKDPTTCKCKADLNGYIAADIASNPRTRFPVPQPWPTPGLRRPRLGWNIGRSRLAFDRCRHSRSCVPRQKEGRRAWWADLPSGPAVVRAGARYVCHA